LLSPRLENALSFLTQLLPVSFPGQIVPFQWENPSAVSGRIAYSRASLNVSQHLLYLQSLNATGAILYDNVSDFPGSYDLESIDKPSLALVQFHCVQIGVIDRDFVSNLLYRDGANMSQPNNVTVRLDGDPSLSFNYWTVVRTNGIWYFVQALICGLSASCAAVALYKLMAFLRKDGRPRLSVAQMALAIEYIQNMIRLFFWAIDPIWLLRGGFSWQATNVFVSVHHPLFISSTLLLALYWHQLLKFDRVKISVGLNKMRIPFGVTSVILVALEILTIGLRIGGFDVGTLTTVSGALIAVVAFATSVYFVVIGVKVLGQLKQHMSQHSDSKEESSIVHRALIQRVRPTRFSPRFRPTLTLLHIRGTDYDIDCEFRCSSPTVRRDRSVVNLPENLLAPNRILCDTFFQRLDFGVHQFVPNLDVQSSGIPGIPLVQGRQQNLSLTSE
jgi:hypothetical protein